MANVLLQSDLVDSTALAERLGDAAAAGYWQQHDRLARALLRGWRGREIDKSDGFLLLFETVADAVAYALAYHRALRGLDPPSSARVGIHTGTMSLRETPPDDVARGAKPLEVDGLAKPVTARLMSLAQGDQTLLSSEAHSALLADPAWRVQSHGHWRLKGVSEPAELFQVGEDGLASFVPPPDSPKAWRVILVDGAWESVARLRHKLPAERDRFVGRGDALQDLATRFDQGARLVSVLGIGGTGKTRISLRYARSWLGAYPGGAWFCDLSQARSFDDIAHAVAHALDVPLGKTDPVEQLGAAIAGRGACLLILDNFEQVARHAESTVGRWMECAQEARFLVTTREVLGIVGEQAMALDPLPIAEGVSLFELRAQASGAYRPTDADRRALPALIALLDGLPLAIELAAPRVRVMPPRVLLERMSERFRLLVVPGGRRDRQATLRATLDWSWDLLGAAERSALAQMAVFQGGFSLDMAESVIDLCAVERAPWVGDVLQWLVEKSLVRQTGNQRFDLLISVQTYAAEQLAANGAFEGSGLSAQRSAWRRHWMAFATLSEEAVTDERRADIDNLIIACRRSAAHGDVDAAVGTLVLAGAALGINGPGSTALELAGDVARMDSLSEAQHAAVCRVAGNAQNLMGGMTLALAEFERGLQLAEAAADLALTVRLRCALAEALWRTGQPQPARRQLEQALATARRLGDRKLEYTALNGLGTLCLESAQLDTAQQLLDEALGIARQLGHRRWQGGLLGNLGIVAHFAGEPESADALYRQALALGSEVGDRLWSANTLCNLGLLCHERGQHADAEAQFEVALLAARDLGSARLESSVLCNLGLAMLAQSRPGDARTRLECACAIAQRLGDGKLLGQCRRHFGRAQWALGNLDAAIESLLHAVTLGEEAGDLFEVAQARCDLARVHSDLGQSGEANRQVSLARESAAGLTGTTRAEIDQAIAALGVRTPNRAGSVA